ncbi:hypothetical protein GF312_22230 [Candidatus Poribacteria bacterium]|nr:hypothetical protein [Candidatus Poribacteria bacterium]
MGIKVGGWCYYDSRHSDIKHLYHKLFVLDEKTLDDMICQASCWRLAELTQEDLIDAAVALDTDMTKDFTIDEEFLQLHTKDQLLDLAKEIELDRHMAKKDEKWDKGKRQDMIDAFLKSGFSLKGVVPKSMELPKEKKQAKGGSK